MPRNRQKLPAPQRGTEVFIGKIPRNVFEDDLFPLFEGMGRIYQLRVMLDFSDLNRGFAFVKYTTPEEANRAVEVLNRYEIRSNRYIEVCKSVDNCRLYLGGLPTNVTREEIFHELSKFAEDVVDVIMYPSSVEGQINRGYVFVEFSNHRMAAVARRTFGSGIQLWRTVITVDWADPIPEVAPDVIKQVTKLYIRKLPIDMDEKLLMKLLKHFLSYTTMKVHKRNDYAFVHFVDHLSAEWALEKLKKSNFYNLDIEVMWARPPQYSKINRLITKPDNFCKSVPPRMRKIVQQLKYEENPTMLPPVPKRSLLPIAHFQPTNEISSNFMGTSA
ncbi:hypothetical protein FQA39_LY15696 [Lamprigera yunnana]|nr:hypothetical protein FQA39_LY15696 [Lamprigera yunnana]